MKLALEFAALLIFFLCFSTGLKAFLHLRHQEWRLSQQRQRHSDNVDQIRNPLDRVA